MELGHEERARRIHKILIYILILNWIVAAAKIVFGALGQSLGMVADGVHSSFDGGANIVGVIAITAASKAPDDDHPYGHRKFEIVGAAIIGMFLAAASFHIGEQAVRRFTTDIRPEASSLQFIVLGVTLLVNTGVSWYEQKKGKEYNSALLLADSQHTRSDIFATLAVIGSLIAARFHLGIVDPIVAMLIAVYVAWMAVRLILGSAQVLADRVVLDPKRVEEVVLSVGGVHDCHEIRTRGTEESVFADLRIHVDAQMTIRKAHEISHAVEDALRREFPGIADVVVHVEPEGIGHD